MNIPAVRLHRLIDPSGFMTAAGDAMCAHMFEIVVLRRTVDKAKRYFATDRFDLRRWRTLAIASASCHRVRLVIKGKGSRFVYCLHTKRLLRRSGTARIVKGYHCFTCTPCVSSASGMSYTCLCLPSCGWHSFTDPGGMEG